MRKLILCLLFALLPALASGQNVYYIDYNSGNNANPGTKAQPWKTHPYMASGLNTGAACVASPPSNYTPHLGGLQDKFYFKGGVVWPNACFQMYVKQGGSSQLSRDYYGIEKDATGVITWYDSASSEPDCNPPHLIVKDRDAYGNLWGKTMTLRSSCQPVFDGGAQVIQAGSGTDNGFMVRIPVSYIEWDNIEQRNQLMPGNQYGAKLLDVDGNDNVIVHHVYLHGMKVLVLNIASISRTAGVVTVVTTAPHQMGPNNDANVAGTNSALDGTNFPDGSPGITIDSPTQFHFTYYDSSARAYCTSTSCPDIPAIHTGTVWAGPGSDTLVGAQSVTNMTFDSNELSNADYNQILNGAAAIIAVPTVTNSVIHDVHTLDLGGNNAINNVWYNACYCPTGNNCPTDDGIQHTNGLALLNDATIANNLIYNFHCNATPVYPSPYWSDTSCTANGGLGSNVYVYNNVIKQGSAPAIGSVMDLDTWNGSGACNGFYIWNNTVEINTVYNFIRLVASGGGTCGAPSATCKAARLLVVQNNHCISSDGNCHFAYNADAWVATGGDTIASNLGQTVTNASSQGYVDGNNFAPGSASGATVGAGTNLTSQGITALDSDVLGVARPSSGTWDIGAYQWINASPAPPPAALIGALRPWWEWAGN